MSSAPFLVVANNADRIRNNYKWLFVCMSGTIISLVVYGITLEYATSQGRDLDEMTFVFVTTIVYAMIAYVGREITGERPSEIPKLQLLFLAAASTGSAVTSIRSLHYVIYPVQVVFKSCKPIPVMIVGIFFKKKYSLSKWCNVLFISIGVAFFMGIGNAYPGDTSSLPSTDTMWGVIMLTISLFFDGITGAFEDKLMAHDEIGPFDLMLHVQLGKALISFISIILTNDFSSFSILLNREGCILLLSLGITGAIGQVFTFLTIFKFGAVNCAVIGLIRKMVSLLLSFVIYKHSLHWSQGVGLACAILAMVLNFTEKVCLLSVSFVYCASVFNDYSLFLFADPVISLMIIYPSAYVGCIAWIDGR